MRFYQPLYLVPITLNPFFFISNFKNLGFSIKVLNTTLILQETKRQEQTLKECQQTLLYFYFFIQSVQKFLSIPRKYCFLTHPLSGSTPLRQGMYQKQVLETSVKKRLGLVQGIVGRKPLDLRLVTVNFQSNP